MPCYETSAREFYMTLQERIEQDAKNLAKQPKVINTPYTWWVGTLSTEARQALESISDPSVKNALYHLQPEELSRFADRHGAEVARDFELEQKQALDSRLEVLESSLSASLNAVGIAR